MKLRLLIIAVSGLALASCNGVKSPSGASPGPSIQEINLFAGSRRVTNLTLDGVVLKVSTTDPYVFPLKLATGSHHLEWLLDGKKKSGNFDVGVGEGALSLRSRPPFFDPEGSVKVKVQPK